MDHTCHSRVFLSETRLLALLESTSEAPHRQVAKRANRPFLIIIINLHSIAKFSSQKYVPSSFSVPPSSSRGERERRSRIPTHQRESGDGMDAAELAASTGQNSDSPQLSGFGMVGLRASQLKLPYYRSSQSSEAGLQDSSEELRGRDDDIGRCDTWL